MLPFVLSVSKPCPEAPLSRSKGVPNGASYYRVCESPSLIIVVLVYDQRQVTALICQLSG